VSKKQNKQARAHPSVQCDPRRQLFLFAAVLIALAAVALGIFEILPAGNDEDAYVPRPRGTITYNKDVAPIFNEHCLNCHRPVNRRIWILSRTQTRRNTQN